MSVPGFDVAQARYDGATPNTREMGDDPGTKCPGFYDVATGDEFICDERSTCHLCGGVLCIEHDDTTDCGDGPAHESCHHRGCWSTACAEDARDDALLQRDEEERGR
jgi:hypothetical protein